MCLGKEKIYCTQLCSTNDDDDNDVRRQWSWTEIARKNCIDFDHSLHKAFFRSSLGTSDKWLDCVDDSWRIITWKLCVMHWHDDASRSKMEISCAITPQNLLNCSCNDFYCHFNDFTFVWTNFCGLSLQLRQNRCVMRLFRA